MKNFLIAKIPSRYLTWVIVQGDNTISRIIVQIGLQERITAIQTELTSPCKEFCICEGIVVSVQPNLTFCLLFI